MSWEGREPWRDEDGVPPERLWEAEQRVVDKRFLDELYAKAERLKAVEAENERLRGYVAAVAAGLPRRAMLAIERELLLDERSCRCV
jgi:hypothetical protein